jgi:hypothetical protein
VSWFAFFLPLVIVGQFTLSVFLARWFISTGRRLAGVAAGLAVIFVLWLAAEGLVYGACLSCKSSDGADSMLCCEWTGVGMIYYAAIALFAAVACLVISFGLIWYYRDRYRQAARRE